MQDRHDLAWQDLQRHVRAYANDPQWDIEALEGTYIEVYIVCTVLYVLCCMYCCSIANYDK